MKCLTTFFTFYVITCIISCSAQSLAVEKVYPEHEKIIRRYFEGWEKKDWNQVSAQLTEGFTFTSAAPDDHISVEKFKEKCWIQADHIRKFEFVNIMGTTDKAFAIVHVITTDNNVIRNVEYFTFSDGKIKAIEVFFGGSGKGFPTNVKEKEK
jgi:hypothetical protein